MSDLGSIENIGTKNPLSQLHAKPSVSMEISSPTSAPESKELSQIQQYEFKMEQADHAFSLMMEVRARLEDAYQNLIPSNKN